MAVSLHGGHVDLHSESVFLVGCILRESLRDIRPRDSTSTYFLPVFVQPNMLINIQRCGRIPNDIQRD